MSEPKTRPLYYYDLGTDSYVEVDKIRPDWMPIETAPLSKTILLWWRPRSDPRYPHPPEHASSLSNNKYAECCVIGQINWHDGMWDGEMPKTWWNGPLQKEQDIWHVTHWMPVPVGPEA